MIEWLFQFKSSIPQAYLENNKRNEGNVQA